MWRFLKTEDIYIVVPFKSSQDKKEPSGMGRSPSSINKIGKWQNYGV